MKREAIIVFMRSKKLWFSAIPDLENYHSLFSVNSVQNPTISPGNLPDGYSTIIQAIK